jgi:hypothetical protein
MLSQPANQEEFTHVTTFISTESTGAGSLYFAMQQILGALQ